MTHIQEILYYNYDHSLMLTYIYTVIPQTNCVLHKWVYAFINVIANICYIRVNKGFEELSAKVISQSNTKQLK